MWSDLDLQSEQCKGKCWCKKFAFVYNLLCLLAKVAFDLNMLFLLLFFSFPLPHPYLTLPRPTTPMPPPTSAPLLCGLSFLTPAGYSFVPPSTAPFWSGTGIRFLSPLVSFCQGRSEAAMFTRHPLRLTPPPILLCVSVYRSSHSRYHLL